MREVKPLPLRFYPPKKQRRLKILIWEGEKSEKVEGGIEVK